MPSGLANRPVDVRSVYHSGMAYNVPSSIDVIGGTGWITSSMPMADHQFQARGASMAKQQSNEGQQEVSRDQLAELLNEDLSREYQAIIAYVVYSQVLKGAEYTDIAAQLELHAKQELDHALIISRQIDYLGKMPAVTPKPVRTSKKPKDMLRFDLDNENETVRNYRDRIRQCEALGEFAMAEQIRQILMQEQDHQIDLATALGIEVPDVSGGPQRRALSKRR